MGQPRARKPAIRLAAYAVIGAAATVGVAWAIAVLVPLPALVPKMGPKSWPCRVPDDWPKAPNVAAASSSLVWRWEMARAIGYPGGSVQVDRIQCGFPFRCVETRDHARWTTPMRLSSGPPGIRVPRRYTRNHSVGLPESPMWSGFIADTAIFGAIAFVLASWAGVRSRLRVARGACPACGYDLKGAMLAECPECGLRREDVAEGRTGEDVPFASAHD